MVVVRVCIVAPHSFAKHPVFIDRHDMKLRLQSPKPGQNTAASTAIPMLAATPTRVSPKFGNWRVFGENV